MNSLLGTTVTALLMGGGAAARESQSWPATVFVGRDGKVKAVHSGFASPASAQFHAQLRKDFTARIEQLLAENTSAATLSDASKTGKDSAAL